MYVRKTKQLERASLLPGLLFLSSKKLNWSAALVCALSASATEVNSFPHACAAPEAGSFSGPSSLPYYLSGSSLLLIMEVQSPSWVRQAFESGCDCWFLTLPGRTKVWDSEQPACVCARPVQHITDVGGPCFKGLKAELCGLISCPEGVSLAMFSKKILRSI